MTRNAKWLVTKGSPLLLGLCSFTAPSFADTAVGYKFSWGEVIAAWRYLDYQFSNHGSTLAMNGPAMGFPLVAPGLGFAPWSAIAPLSSATRFRAPREP